MARYPQTVLVSCEIPWDEQQNLLEDVFRAEVRMALAQGLKHVYIFGTAGEGYAVDTRRFHQIVRIFYAETRAEDVHAQVGVIGLSTANIVERIAFAHEVGFRVFQISLPSWGALNDVELLTFFRDVCGAFPDSQFLHYNLPRARRILNGADYRRLADAVPNLAATKNTGGGAQRAADLMRRAPDLQHFFGEDNFMHGCLFGECSLLASLGPMTPRKTWAYFEAGRDRRLDELLTLHHGFLSIIGDVFGPALAQERIDGAYDKMIVRMGGLEDMPLRMLSPYQGFDESEYLEYKRVFDERYADWQG
jgi:dihydrodipicolinate synthase/N-acetylneuraminate lyase